PTLSNASLVVIKAANVTGKYSCEVSADAPSFHTMIVSGDMEVIEPPLDKPSIIGVQTRYRPGDILRGNCSSLHSKPAANLSWSINDVPVLQQQTRQYRSIKDESTGLETSVLGINVMVSHSHFNKGKLKLKCEASIHQIYHESTERLLEEDRPRILATGTSSGQHNMNLFQSSVYDGELTDQGDRYLTMNGYKAPVVPKLHRTLSDESRHDPTHRVRTGFVSTGPDLAYTFLTIRSTCQVPCARCQA
ncbi:hypothetical protein pipiens_013430, partial [Culex pipiens pipiens]